MKIFHLSVKINAYSLSVPLPSNSLLCDSDLVWISYRNRGSRPNIWFNLQRMTTGKLDLSSFTYVLYVAMPHDVSIAGTECGSYNPAADK
ncbi:MAG: hypothetical protein ACI8WM_000269 [Burkholderiaceae bacterium]|jgi:hypothetical protein